MSLRTNRDKLVMHSVQGTVSHPSFAGYRVTTDGEPYIIPGTGAINYNIHVGDAAFGLAGDHIEPSVSIKNSNERFNAALAIFSCVGNTAKIVSGDAKGKLGYVLGTHGGIEQVIIEFADEIMDDMTMDDKILIKGYGQGLKLLDYPQVKVMSLSPDILEKMAIDEVDCALNIPVTTVIPSHLMGSGVGAPYSAKGDYDIITSDGHEVAKYGLDKLRFGDFVYLQNADCCYGLGGYLEGAASIGVIVHSDCIKNGHGLGVVIVMTCPDGTLQPKIDPNANLSAYMPELLVF